MEWHGNVTEESPDVNAYIKALLRYLSSKSMTRKK